MHGPIALVVQADANDEGIAGLGIAGGYFHQHLARCGRAARCPLRRDVARGESLGCGSLLLAAAELGLGLFEDALRDGGVLLAELLLSLEAGGAGQAVEGCRVRRVEIEGAVIGGDGFYVVACRQGPGAFEGLVSCGCQLLGLGCLPALRQPALVSRRRRHR